MKLLPELLKMFWSNLVSQNRSQLPDRGGVMPDKPIMRLLPARRRARPKTRAMKSAKTKSQINDERMKNLAKARRKRKKNLQSAKKRG